MKILTDEHRMQAFLPSAADQVRKDTTQDDVIQALQAAGVRVTDPVRERVKELIGAAQSGAVPVGNFVLAEGVPPVESQDGEFVFNDPPAVGATSDSDGETDGPDDNVSGRIDFFELTHIRTAEAGGTLGRLTPPIAGKAGMDVCGHPIPPRRAPTGITLGDNVELAPDGREVRATSCGIVRWAARHLAVQPVVEIKGNVDFESGSLDAPANVLVRGDVLDSFHVRSVGDIAINGSVGACEIKAGGDIKVLGGIAGKEKGHVEAQGRIAAKFCDECVVHAEGDLVITKEALNSRLYTHGRLGMPRGSIIGGYTYARCGGDLKSLGSERGIRTLIAIGIDPEVLEQCSKIDEQMVKRRESVAKIRGAVAPLMQQLKRLLPAQRERATELLYEADQIESGIQALVQEKEDILKKATPDALPFLSVSLRILPGVTIIIGDRMTTFAKEIRGPIKIMRRRIDRIEELVAVNDLTASVSILPSRDSHLKIES